MARKKSSGLWEIKFPKFKTLIKLATFFRPTYKNKNCTAKIETSVYVEHNTCHKSGKFRGVAQYIVMLLNI